LFSRSTNVDNKWFPLTPGTQLTYVGNTIEDGERIAHRVVSGSSQRSVVTAPRHGFRLEP